MDPLWIRSAALSGILFLLVLYTMYLAASLLIPITLALLLNVILAPLVRLLWRARVPKPASAVLIVVSLAACVSAGLYALADPAMDWFERAPAELEQLESKLGWVSQSVEEVQRASDRVSELTDLDEGEEERAASAEAASFSLVGALLGAAPPILFGISVTLILLFFLLASGDELLNKCVQVTPTFKDKRRVVEIGHDIQSHVSTYLGTIALINTCVGVVTGVAMWILGMPNPILWGVLVGVMNFIPYLGVAISLVVIGFVSLLTFDSPGQMLLPPAVIFAINVVEGQFLTPILAGRRLALSPVAVFLSLVIMGWIWGVIGVLIAVPLLASIKLVCEEIEPLSFVATFLGSDHQ